MKGNQTQKILWSLYLGLLTIMLAVIGGSCLSMVVISAYNEATAVYYQVKFSYNRQIVDTQNVGAGKCAREPSLANYETINFCGWTLDGETVIDVATNPITGNTVYSALFTGDVFKPMQWQTDDMPWMTNFFGDMIWYDFDENVFYSCGDYQVQLTNHNTWEQQHWQGLTNFNGNMVWHDDKQIYYSNGTEQYVLSESQTWQKQNWRNLDCFYGASIWHVGATYYYSYGKQQYYLAADNTWQMQNWQGLAAFDGRYVWQDGQNVYYSKGDEQYVLVGTQWQPQTWQGLNALNGCDVWHDETNCYYSYGKENYRKDGNQWKKIVFQLVENTVEISALDYHIIGQYVWNAGNNIYFSNGGTTYQISTLNQTVTYHQWPQVTYLNLNRIIQYQQNVYYYTNNVFALLDDGKWNQTEWLKFDDTLPNLASPLYLWIVGDQIFYSDKSQQFTYDFATANWVEVPWNNLASFERAKIWAIDDERIFYSHNQNQYYLDIDTYTWREMSWQGLDSFLTGDIWQFTDQNNHKHVYCSQKNRHYELDLMTMTWQEKTWFGLTNFDAANIWFDENHNVYYSAGEQQYVLDQTSNTWQKKVWHGLDNFYGKSIWHDAEMKTYFSCYERQYQLMINDVYAPELLN